MEVAHRKFGNEWGQFDRYCKLVLYHEAIDYLRELQRQCDHEKPLDALSPEEWDKLSTVDRYPSDSFAFSSHGCSLYIENELVAAAFAGFCDRRSLHQGFRSNKACVAALRRLHKQAVYLDAL